ncbi:hypothetical protein [Paenibacillus woosongensis]|uniref:Uncharacterized protein n=1 Tax=Paenibacillus woosongensis TaxID=307580 RepID=A0ABQ4MQA3_9BACL|nr:hypothetical protein [Paenibacillus woosongensis]GIP57897.1 hypothetical protein J15TS10_17110 [Paenibacillus woosongensis]
MSEEFESVGPLDEKYRELMVETVLNTYPKYIQKDLLGTLEQHGVVKLKKKMTIKKGAQTIDLSEKEEDERLTEGLAFQPVMRAVEKREFTKSYHFSAIFAVNGKQETNFAELVQEGKLLDFTAANFTHDNVMDVNHPTEVVPTMFAIGKIKIIKFTKILTGFLPTTASRKRIKYNVLGVYHEYLDILEIRFDRARSLYQYEDDLFYHNQVLGVLNWFERVANFEIENINIPPVISYINKKDQDEVVVHSQAMSMSTGAKAELYTAENGAPILPLLGELKELIKTHEELFEQSPEIKDLLDKFITETEDTSDLPWISLRWKGDAKNEGMLVKFKHNYENKGYTLLNFFGRQTNMEKMNNVTKYIIDNKAELDERESSAAPEIGETSDNTQEVF